MAVRYRHSNFFSQPPEENGHLTVYSETAHCVVRLSRTTFWRPYVICVSDRECLRIFAEADSLLEAMAVLQAAKERKG